MDKSMNKLVSQLHAEYSDKRIKNEQIAMQRRDIVYRQMPRIKAIDQQMATIAKDIVQVVLKNPQQAGHAVEEMARVSKALKKEKHHILRQEGYDIEYLAPIYDCIDCKDRGYDLSGKRCHCFQKNLIELAYRQSDLRHKLKQENFNTFNAELFSDVVNDTYGLSPRQNIVEIGEVAMGFIASFDEQNGQNLLFYGGTGLGKTFMCSAIAKALIDRHKTVVYQTSHALFDVVRKRALNSQQDTDNALRYEMLYRADLLIIDDLGTENSSAFTQSELFSIINSRLNEQKKTVISTNLSPLEISNCYGERTTSRFLGHYNIIRFFGEDLRLK